MLNKRGLEHPQEVIRMLFIAVILILSIVIIFNLMQNINAINEYKTMNLKYNVIATKILYSSDCYALKDSYTLEGETRYQVHAGILDSSNLVEGRLEDCIGSGQSEVTITYSDQEFTDKKGCDGGWSDTRQMLVMVGDEPGEAEIKVCV